MSGGGAGGSLGLPAWLPCPGGQRSPYRAPAESSATSPNVLTPLVLACQLRHGGTPRVQVMDHEGEGSKWGFYGFPKGK